MHCAPTLLEIVNNFFLINNINNVKLNFYYYRNSKP